jgi:hypothetical protein
MLNYFYEQNKEELKLLIMFGKKLKKGNSTRCMKHVHHWSNLYRNLADYNMRGTI